MTSAFRATGIGYFVEAYSYLALVKDKVPETESETAAPSLQPTLCPICGGTPIGDFRKNDCLILKCTTCGGKTTAGTFGAEHLNATYDDDYFFGGGAGYENYLEEAELLRQQGVRYADVLEKYLPQGRLLDVGCAAGFLQAGFEERGWSTTGLEPNASMVSHAQEKLGLHVVQGSLESVGELPPFDAVCLIQVIGHFHNLTQAMQSVSELTREDGLCLIEYWRMDSWVAKMFGKNWHEYSPPSVLHWFSRSSLDELMQNHGFAPVTGGIPKKYISAGHAASLAEHALQSTPLPGFLTKPLRILPKTLKLRYPAFDLEWRLYRRTRSA